MLPLFNEDCISLELEPMIMGFLFFILSQSSVTSIELRSSCNFCCEIRNSFKSNVFLHYYYRMLSSCF